VQAAAAAAALPLSKGSLGVSTIHGGVMAAMFLGGLLSLGGLLFVGLGGVASFHSAWLQIGAAQWDDYT
jgi:hypothetical protein